MLFIIHPICNENRRVIASQQYKINLKNFDDMDQFIEQHPQYVDSLF